MKLSELKEIIIKKYGKKGLQRLENLEEYKMYVALEEKQLEEIKEYPFSIQYMNNPSEELQLESIKKGPWNFAFIKNPTDKVIVEVLKSNTHIRTLIKDILRHIEDDINK